MSSLQELRNLRWFAPALLLFQPWVFANSAAPGHQFRPAMIGNGPKSLVNLIDQKKVIQQGQRDGVVMFDVIVDGSDGSADIVWCHGPREVKALKAEVQKAALRASYVPALIDGKPVEVSLHGAVIFVVRDGHPFLKVFANQDTAELAKQTDYIQPQLIDGSTDWEGAKPMLEVVKNHAKTGHAILSLTVDAEGGLQERHLLREDPAGLNIGAAAMKAYATAKFIPGFRSGKPVTCTYQENWAVRGYVYRRW